MKFRYNYPFKITQHNDDSVYYLVQGIDYPEAISEAKTFDDALKNAQELLDLVLSYAFKHGTVISPTEIEGDDIYYIAPSK